MRQFPCEPAFTATRHDSYARTVSHDGRTWKETGKSTGVWEGELGASWVQDRFVRVSMSGCQRSFACSRT